MSSLLSVMFKMIPRQDIITEPMSQKKKRKKEMMLPYQYRNTELCFHVQTDLKVQSPEKQSR